MNWNVIKLKYKIEKRLFPVLPLMLWAYSPHSPTRKLHNKLYVTWTFSGTNNGPFFNQPPTNEQVKNYGSAIWTFNDKGQPIREDIFFDWMDVLTQLGYTFFLSVPNDKFGLFFLNYL